jgi:predicted phosphoribosyltransferase
MFNSREDAARQLAREFESIELSSPIVLAIPRGGVVTGAILAKALNADLDVVLARKLRAPYQPELAIGAIGEDGAVYLNQTVGAFGVDEQYLAAEKERQLQAIEERQKLFRGGASLANVAGRTVIVTDDGVATGSTLIAALNVVNALSPLEVIVAVPVAPLDRVPILNEYCDRLICLIKAPDFQAVGQFYRSFQPVEDAEAARMLQEFTPST